MTEQRSQNSWSVELFGPFQIRDYIELARRRKMWILATALAVFLCTAVVAWRMPNTYRAETVILVDPQKVPDNYVASTVTSSIADRLSTIRQQVMSPSRLQRLMDNLDLYPKSRGKAHDQELIRKVQKATTIEVVDAGGQRLSAFRIAFHGSDPAQVARVANELAAMFIQENLKAREQQFFGTAEFLDHELQDTKHELEAKERQLQQAKSRFILDLPEAKQYHLEALGNLRDKLRASQDRVSRARQSKVYLQSMMGTSAPTVDLDSESGSAASPFQTQIQKLESQLRELQVRYGPKHPDVRKLQEQIHRLKTKVPAEPESAVAQEQPGKLPKRTMRNPVIEAEIATLDQEIEEQTKLQPDLERQMQFHISKLERVPVFEQQIADLMRDYDTLRGHYGRLLDKKLSAEMAMALESRQKGERFLILDPAVVPQEPFGPNRPLLALAGLLGGLMSGIGMAFLVENMDESVRDEREAERIVGRPVLAGIPHIATAQQRRWDRLHMTGTLAGTAVGSMILGIIISRVIGGL